MSLPAMAEQPFDAGPSPDVREGEVPFGYEEIFFSRTDGRGVI